MAYIGFNADSVPDVPNSYDPLPAGDYLVEISATNVEMSQKGNELLKVTFDVLQPDQYQGRKVFSNYTIGGNNPVAIATGQGILKQVCRSIGLMHVTDSAEMHGIPLCIRVVVKEYQGKVSNEPVAYWSTQSAPPPQSKAKPSAPSSAAPGGYAQPGQSQPWQAPRQAPPPQGQPWQQAPAPAQQYAPPPQAPVQQQMNLQPQYRTQAPAPARYAPPPQAPAPQAQPQYAPQAQQAAPPWAQAPAQQMPPAEPEYDDGQPPF